jgi:hypothetical protein
MNSLVEQFGRKGLITIYGMTTCALLGIFKVDIAVITCVAGMVAVFNGADTVITRGYAKAQQAQAEQGRAEATAAISADIAAARVR